MPQKMYPGEIVDGLQDPLKRSQKWAGSSHAVLQMLQQDDNVETF